MPICEQGKCQHSDSLALQIPPRRLLPITEAKSGFIFPVCSNYFKEKPEIVAFIYAPLLTQEMSQVLGNAVSISMICVFLTLLVAIHNPCTFQFPKVRNLVASWQDTTREE